MKYAYSQYTINPRIPVRQYGHIQQVDPVSKVHDDLHARIFALEDEKLIWIHISMDILQVRLELQNRLKEAYQKTTLKQVAITLSCTHNHYAGDPRIDTYFEQLYEDTIAELNKLEFHESDDLSLSYQYTPFEGLGKSRISNHEAKVILGLISIYDKDEPIVTFFYYNCHPTILNADDTDFFSADWPGYVLSKLKERHPERFFSFFQGPAGDVSTRFTRPGQDYESVMKLGDVLIAKIEELMADETPRHKITLSYENHTVHCENSFDDEIFEHLPEGLTDRELEVISYGKIVRQELKDKTDDLVEEVLISKTDLGSLSLVFVPDEMFSDYLKYINLEKAILVCYSNGLAYYLTPYDHLIISYETLTDTFTIDTKKKIAEVLLRYGN